VRGLNSADNTRDFFLTDIPFDTYNTSRIDIQRGANSILFGNGSPAGIINGSTDGAILGRDTTTVQARYDSFGSYRGSLNINRDIIPGELAIRFASLYDKEYFQQEPAFERDTRNYGAIRWEPRLLKKGSARTTIRLSYEDGSIRANRPRVNTINDAITPWFRQTAEELRSPYPLGRPEGVDQTLLGVLTPLKTHAGYDPFVTGISDAALTALRPDVGVRANFNATSNPNSEPWLGALTKTNEQGASQLGPGFDVSGGGYNAWQARFYDPNSSDLGMYVYPSIGSNNYWALNSLGARDGNGVNGIRAPDQTGLLRLDQYSFRGLGSLLYTLQGVWRSTTITDPSIFDFYNKLIDGPNKGEGSKFDAFNATIDQTFWNDRFGFQIAYDRQNYSSYRWAMLNNPTLTIDIYTKLPIANYNAATGVYEPMDNPNFGRPYIVSNATGNNISSNERMTQRITPYVDLNFKELLKTDNWATKVLGRHTITGLYERHKFQSESMNYALYSVDPVQAATIFGPNRTATGNERNVATYSYIGPNMASSTSLSGADLSAINALQQPRTYLQESSTNSAANAYWWDSTWTGATLPAGATAAWTRPALGLAPNQVGTSTSASENVQAENPVNYRAWTGTPRQLNVMNSQFGDPKDLALSASASLRKVTSKAVVDQWKLLDDNLVVTAGLRKDTVRTYTPGNPSLAADSTSRTGQRNRPNETGLVDWDAPFEYPDSPSASYTSDWLKTYGAVLHTPNFINRRLPLGLQFSVFYSESENFQPLTRKDVITGDNLVPPSGDTKDYGAMVSAFDGKMSLRVTRYETTVNNASLQDNSIINFIRDEVVRGIQFSKSVLWIRDVNNGANGGEPGTAGNGGYHYRASTLPSGGETIDDTHWYPWQPARPATAAEPWTLAEWQAEEAHAIRAANAFLDSLNTPAAQRFLEVYNIHPEDWSYTMANNNITATAPSGLSVTADTVSKGTEYELFLRPLDNWSITFNAAKTYATRANLAGNAAEWLNTRWALYNEPDPEYAGGLLAGDVRWFGGGQGNVSSGNARFGRNGYKFFSEFAALEGTNVPELRPWRYNLVTNYSFNRGRLKGLFVGGAYRWEDKSIIGFGLTETDAEVLRQTSSGTQSVRAAIGRLDPSKPFYGPEEKHFDVFIGYNRKIWTGVDWKIQLNVRNVGESAHLVPITANPDGSGAAYRIAAGANWYVTSTFGF
jgi:outer membrane receptor protein involved in Fe transport